jgi:pimeloyl-ACP methyl ester carboxylesterase
VRTNITISALLLLASACTTGSEGGERATYEPVFRDEECPAEVLIGILLDARCGRLTVPEDRQDPNGRSVGLFVIRISPSVVDPALDPMLDLGGDLGVGADAAGYAPMADRIGREVIMIDPRGVGYSTPNLACPEVEEVAGPALAAPSDDAALHERFFDNVAACHARIASSGVDPSNFGIADAAADVEDLRIALGIGEWSISSHGTMSRVTLEVVRRYPEHVRALVLDSPDWPEVDPFGQSVEGTRFALEELARACPEHIACSGSFRDLGGTIADLLVRFQDDPVDVAFGPSEGEMLLDGAMLLRLMRFTLSTNQDVDLVHEMVRMLVALESGELSSAGTLLAIAQGGQAYCPGYLPTCSPALGFYQGAYYSILCGDIVPFLEAGAVDGLVTGDIAYTAAFAGSPYRDVCDAWPVEPARESVHQPIRSDVPTLVLLGGLDPFATVSSARDGSVGLSTSWIVVDPTVGHSVTGASACLQDIRNEWVQDPTRPPEIPACATSA